MTTRMSPTTAPSAATTAPSLNALRRHGGATPADFACWFFHSPVPNDTTRDNYDFAALIQKVAGFKFACELDHVGARLLPLRDEHARDGKGVERRQMTPARLREPAQQRGRRCFEVKHAAVDVPGAQVGNVVRQVRQSGAARIDAHSYALMAGVSKEVHHFRQQLAREIVHAIETGVLEDVQRDAFSGARKPTNED